MQISTNYDISVYIIPLVWITLAYPNLFGIKGFVVVVVVVWITSLLHQLSLLQEWRLHLYDSSEKQIFVMIHY
jgi:hypothetical protein